MTKLRQLLFCLLLVWASGRVEAALFGGEEKAFKAASELFRLEQWESAEQELAEFVQEFPKSEHLVKAVWLEAQALYQLGKYQEAAALLQAKQIAAGNLADQFLYWTAKSQFEATNYTAAAATFGKLAREFPASPLRLEAAVSEADAFGKLGDWEKVVELLHRADGPFRLSANGSEMAARGFLLQAEGQLASKKYPDAEASLKRISGVLSGELEWWRRSLLCRTLVEWGGHEAAAIEESTGMIAAARNTRQFELLSDSVVFRADLLERMGRRDEAIETLRLNLTNAPVARQRQALTRIVALEIQQDQVSKATQTLESYLALNTNTPIADVAWLTLGELHLKQHVGRLPVSDANGAAVNHLVLATNCFGILLKNYPGSTYVGKAQLDLGWCYWIEGKFAESAAAFAAATSRLPKSEDLAVARFKLADAEFEQNDYAAAFTNYQVVLQLATNWPAVNAALRTSASYQSLRAGLALTNNQGEVNVAGAEAAMRGLLAADPTSSIAVSSVLLVAQAYVDVKESSEAQRLFGEFVSRYPESELRPEVELLMARMREEQGDWTNVVQSYEAWLAQFPTNRLRAQVEFQRALATARSGAPTNALMLFTNFVAQFPTHELAPRAQWWVAVWYYNRGNFLDAEISFKQLLNNWPNSELAYEAKMMAGRAALGRRDYARAIEHFTSLTSDTNCPPALWMQAMSAYGGTLMQSGQSDTNRVQALLVFKFIVQKYPTNDYAAAAWGDIGNCALQLAASDPTYYTTASNAYQQAMDFSTASVAVRSQARVGLASVLEKQAALQSDATGSTAFLKQARDLDLDVYLGKQLAEGEIPEVYWKKRAGMEAARLSESLGEWPQAIDLYRDMLRQKLLPPDVTEKKVANVEKQIPSVPKIN